MKTTAEIYNKIKEIDQNVKKKLKTQGIVVPKKRSDGSVVIGLYKIVRTSDGFYNILNFANETIIENINLPHTAALLANKLALGKFIDTKILNDDRKYGHAYFEESLQNHLANKNLKNKRIEAADLMLIKAKISKLKKEYYKREILIGFDKLMSFR